MLNYSLHIHVRLEAFAATEFNEIFSGGEPRQNL